MMAITIKTDEDLPIYLIQWLLSGPSALTSAMGTISLLEHGLINMPLSTCHREKQSWGRVALNQPRRSADHEKSYSERTANIHKMKNSDSRHLTRIIFYFGPGHQSGAAHRADRYAMKNYFKIKKKIIESQRFC